MSLHPLPLPPSLDLSIPASLEYWLAEPPRLHGWQPAEFWVRMPPLTAAQFLALRLGRHPTHVSLAVTQVRSQRFEDRVRHGDMERFDLPSSRGIFARTHSALLFRFDPSRLRRRPPDHHPLAPLLEWVRPDQWLESRFLMAGLPQPMPWADRGEVVYDALRRGARQGYVLDLHRYHLAAAAYRPSKRWCRKFDIEQPRLKETAVEHGILAVEAALYRADSYGPCARIHTLRSEADLMAESRAGLPSRGLRYAVTPDVEAELTTGQRYWVEMLSREYKHEDLTAKFAGISRPTDFVATSLTLARRVERAVPRIACYYF